MNLHVGINLWGFFVTGGGKFTLLFWCLSTQIYFIYHFTVMTIFQSFHSILLSFTNTHEPYLWCSQSHHENFPGRPWQFLSWLRSVESCVPAGETSVSPQMNGWMGEAGSKDGKQRTGVVALRPGTLNVRSPWVHWKTPTWRESRKEEVEVWEEG